MSTLVGALLDGSASTAAGVAPSPAYAQGRAIAPSDVALTPSDLEPGFRIRQDETETGPLDGIRGVYYTVLLERVGDPNPQYVTQYIARFDEPWDMSGFLSYMREEAVNEHGHELVPGAPNDGGTLSLMTRAAIKRRTRSDSSRGG